MARVQTPRELMMYFNSNYEIQRFFESLAFAIPNSESESNVKIIGSESFSLTSSEGSITIDASANPVTIILPVPNVYKGKIYRIDVKDATNKVLIDGVLNDLDQQFEMFVDESIIIQDNGSSYRVK